VSDGVARLAQVNPFSSSSRADARESVIGGALGESRGRPRTRRPPCIAAGYGSKL
jgi:hypothetical protein